MKGIILAAGNGTRLTPLTSCVPKPLLPVYDKPMISYPLYTLIEAGIKEIIMIVSKDYIDMYKKIYGDGTNFGIKIYYEIQEVPKGVADAFAITKDYIVGEKSILIFGDNIFLGNDMENKLKEGIKNLENGFSSIVCKEVSDPKRFGIVELDGNKNILSIEEKPEFPKSNMASTGLYFYDQTVLDKFSKIKPSIRGEYEITDINKLYVSENKLKGIFIEEKEEIYWEDTGNIESLYETSKIVHELTIKNGKRINIPEEIALRKGYIQREDLMKNSNADKMYGGYLKKLYEEN